MAIPYVTNLPVSPTLTDPVNFPTRADAFMVALDGFSESCNAAIDEMNNVNDAIDAKYVIASIGGTFEGAWVSGATYSVNDVVSYSDVYYRNITGVNTSTNPLSDTTNWANAMQDVYLKSEVDALLATKVTKGTAFCAESASNQSITSGVATKVIFGTENFDKNTDYDVATSRFTAIENGIYHFSAQIDITTGTSGQCRIYKNGLPIAEGRIVASFSANTKVAVSKDVELAIGDYVEIYAAITGTSPQVYGSYNTFFCGHKVRS